jgi:chromosome partitioning protein
MSRRLVFTNRKGGCGKTTTSVNVAAALAHMGYRVLVIDTDPQAHATMSLGVSLGAVSSDLSHVLEGRVSAGEVLHPSYVPRLQVLPSSRRLADFERRYANSKEARFWMRDHLGHVMDDFEYTIFDTPPTTQLLTVGSLIAGSEAYVPMQAHFLAMEGMIEIVELIDQVRRHFNPDLTVKGIIPTFYEEGSHFSDELLKELSHRLGSELLMKPIHLNRALAEAPGRGHTIFQHELRSEGAVDYYRVALQIRNQGAPR